MNALEVTAFLAGAALVGVVEYLLLHRIARVL